MKTGMLCLLCCSFFFALPVHADGLPSNPWKKNDTVRLKSSVNRMQNSVEDYLNSSSVSQIQNYSSEASLRFLEQAQKRAEQIRQNNAKRLENERRQLQLEAERQKKIAEEEAKKQDTGILAKIGNFFSGSDSSAANNEQQNSPQTADSDWEKEYDAFMKKANKGVNTIKKTFSSDLPNAAGKIMKNIK